MSAQLTPSKRSHDRSPADFNGRRKWQKSSALGSDKSPRGSPPNNIIRILCPASTIDDVIGKDSSFISQICQETGAKVRVEEPVPGSDERVIVIAGSDKDNEVGTEEINADDKEAKANESVDDPDAPEGTDNAEQSVGVADSQPDKEKESSLIQEALLIIFEKLFNRLPEPNAGDEDSNKPSSLVLRLLVFSSQVGRLLGKAGSVIKQMSSESGAQIRILPKDKVPSCASSSDELVQISGGLDAVKKALRSVSEQLLQFNVRDQESFSGNAVGSSSHSFGPHKNDRFSSSNRHGAPYSSGYRDGEPGVHGRVNIPPDVLTFRLLCNEEKVGGVIGKGGSVVRGLQHETGCEIKVLDGGDDPENRIIVISGPAHPDDRISPPQDAALRVQARIFRSAPESKEKTMTAKLLVASNQIGCLLGKGGSVIAEMRKSTGAYIRILGKDQVPKCASENEEVVQVNGELEVVQEALVQITARLKSHFFRDAFPPMGPLPNPAYLDQMPPFPSYMGRREFSPSAAFPHRGPPFNKFDGPGGLPPVGGFHLRDEHPPFAHDIPRPGMPPHMSERMPPWGPQGPMEGAGPMGFHDYPGAPPQRRPGGFTGGNLAVITSTTVEVVVPSFVVPVIYGEDGGCLRQIREISDAKITITDSKPGAPETRIIIYGTPEQTNAAQSLIQAFVICETESR